MHYVYYLHDSAGSLLYIGRTTDPKRRWRSFQMRTKLTVHLGISQRHSDFNLACAAELKAISKHWPPYNKKLVSVSGMLGKKHSERAKQRTEEFRAYCKTINLGRICTEEHRRKLSAATKGRPKSEETRQNMREAWQRRKGLA